MYVYAFCITHLFAFQFWLVSLYWYQLWLFRSDCGCERQSPLRDFHTIITWLDIDQAYTYTSEDLCVKNEISCSWSERFWRLLAKSNYVCHSAIMNRTEAFLMNLTEQMFHLKSTVKKIFHASFWVMSSQLWKCLVNIFYKDNTNVDDNVHYRLS